MGFLKKICYNLGKRFHLFTHSSIIESTFTELLLFDRDCAGWRRVGVGSWGVK